MKGVAMAIETIVYLVLAVTVLAVLLAFFLTQGGKAQGQFSLEANRERYCATYTATDPTCAGKDKAPLPIAADVIKNIRDSCNALAKQSGYSYMCGGDSSDTDLACIQSCCLTCSSKTEVKTTP